jgi:hypothetical protein
MSETTALQAAARFGLADPVAPPPVLTIADSGRWQMITRIDRMGGLLSSAIEAGHVVADDEASDRVADIWHQQLIASVVVEALVVRTAEVLDEAGVTWRLTKGAAVAHLDYPDPALRPFGDADVLVHPADWASAVHALVESGCRRQRPELGPGWDDRFGKGATLNSPEGLEIDLHRRFAIGRFGVRSRMDDLYGVGDSIELAGRSIPTLDGPGRLLHSCHHAALGGFRHYRAHRDVAQQLLVTEVDWRATVEIASAWRVKAVVARAITDTWQVLGLDVEHPAHAWAASTRISRPDRWALDVFAAEKPFRQQALTAVGAMPCNEAPAYLWPFAKRPGVARRFARVQFLGTSRQRRQTGAAGDPRPPRSPR